MVASSAKLLGVGLYTVREAALFARIAPKKMGRWLFGDKQGEAVLDRQLQSDERLVTFLDFVQSLAVRAIRIQHKVPLPKIRQAVTVAQRDYGVEYPFAQKHKTFLHNGEVVIKVGNEEYVEVSGEHTGSRLMTQIVEIFLEDLTFDVRGLAVQYKAFGYRERAVTMDPAIRFGEPMVANSGYSAKALWEASQTEGGVEQAAKAYDVSPEDIAVACRYYDHLISPSAA